MFGWWPARSTRPQGNLSRRELSTLDAIEGAMNESEPQLRKMLEIFTRLGEEEPVKAEPLGSPSRRRRLIRRLLRRRSPGPEVDRALIRHPAGGRRGQPSEKPSVEEPADGGQSTVRMVAQAIVVVLVVAAFIALLIAFAPNDKGGSTQQACAEAAMYCETNWSQQRTPASDHPHPARQASIPSSAAATP